MRRRDDAEERCAKRIERILTEQCDVVGFDVEFQIVRGAEIVPTGIGKANERCATVLRIGNADHQPLLFEIVDDMTGALFGHTGAFGNDRCPRALQIDMRQDGDVCGAKPIISALAQELDRPRAVRAVRLQEEAADMVIADRPDFIGLVVRCWHVPLLTIWTTEFTIYLDNLVDFITWLASHRDDVRKFGLEQSKMIVIRNEQAQSFDTPGANNTTGLATPGTGATGTSVIRQRQQPGGNNPAHFHDREEVMIVLRGAVTVTSADEAVTLGPGDTLIIPERAVHQLATAGNVEAEWLLAASAGIGFFHADGTRADPAWAR